MNDGFYGLPGFNPEVLAGPWGNSGIPLRAVPNGTQLVISAGSREGGVLGGNGPATVVFPHYDAAVGDCRPRKIVQPVPPIIIATGSTMGFTSAVSGRLWVVLIDDVSGPCLGVVNGLSSAFATYPLRPSGLISTLALSGGASAALQPYSTRAITSRPYVVLGYLTWETALTTAGTWDARPGVVRLFGPGVDLPGQRVQSVPNYVRATASGATATPADNTAPTIAEGNQFFTATITPTSKANLLHHRVVAPVACNTGTDTATTSLHQDGGGSIAATATPIITSLQYALCGLEHRMLAGTVSATAFTVRIGPAAAGTIRINWSLASAAQAYGTVSSALYEVTEITG